MPAAAINALGGQGLPGVGCFVFERFKGLLDSFIQLFEVLIINRQALRFGQFGGGGADIGGRETGANLVKFLNQTALEILGAVGAQEI
jgi:hypothetical protein